MKNFSLVALFVCILAFSGCGISLPERTPVQTEFFAMDTYMNLTAYGKNADKALESAKNEILRLDETLNAADPESEIAKINSRGGGVLSEDLGRIVSVSLELYRDTEGAFDISIYPLTKLWGFPDDALHIPTEDELAETLSCIGSDAITYNEDSQELFFGKSDMAMDAGGIGKGYASECAARILRDEGISSALLNLGGNVLAIGGKPDGSSWNIAIQDPNQNDGYLGIIGISDACVITSGPYERYFEEKGVRYHHILDPSTGYPAESGLLSVSVISGNPTQADGLSTALFVMGKEKAFSYWREHRNDFDMILQDEAGTVFVTEGVASDFRSDYEVQLIS